MGPYCVKHLLLAEECLPRASGCCSIVVVPWTQRLIVTASVTVLAAMPGAGYDSSTREMKIVGKGELMI